MFTKPFRHSLSLIPPCTKTGTSSPNEGVNDFKNLATEGLRMRGACTLRDGDNSGDDGDEEAENEGDGVDEDGYGGGDDEGTRTTSVTSILSTGMLNELLWIVAGDKLGGSEAGPSVGGCIAISNPFAYKVSSCLLERVLHDVTNGSPLVIADFSFSASISCIPFVWITIP